MWWNPVIDLHTFPVEAARVAAACAVLDAALEAPANLIFIVGVGTGSHEGRPLLGPAVRAMLSEELEPPLVVRYQDNNSGCLQVSGISE